MRTQNTNQLSFEFTFTQLRELVRGLDAQLDEALEQMGVGNDDWNGSLQSRFAFWLHIHVFQDAVNILADSRSGKATKLEAAEWLFSDDDSDPYAFRNVARILRVDSGELLGRLMERADVQRGLALIRH